MKSRRTVARPIASGVRSSAPEIWRAALTTAFLSAILTSLIACIFVPNFVYRRISARLGQLEQKVNKITYGGAASVAPQASSSVAPVSGTLGKSDLDKVLQSIHKKGNTQARYLWLEYSDLECPFCIRLHGSGAIEQLLAADKDLAFVFKHHPLGFHKNARYGAYAAECVAEASGDEKFYAFIEASFKKGAPTEANVATVVGELGLNIESIKTCIASDKFKSLVDESLGQARPLFGIRGTPGSVLIDTQTGAYRVVSGAQAAEAYSKALEQLKKGDK